MPNTTKACIAHEGRSAALTHTTSSINTMSVRVRTLEIRWHHSAEKNYSEPIYACDFQPLPVNQLKKLVAPRIQQGRDKEKDATGPGYGQCYRLVTGGGDNNIRVSRELAIPIRC